MSGPSEHDDKNTTDMKRLMLVAALAAIWTAADAKLALRHPTGDHMVLQQQTEAAVWGFASPGSMVSVTPSWDGNTYTVRTAADGRWKAMVATPAAGYTPYEIRIGGDGSEIVVRDVLIGEVWLASGQSNMEMPVKGWPNCPLENSAEVITRAPARDRIRMIYAHADQTDEPLAEIRNTSGWECADPVSVPEMSAVAYFFAFKLNQVLDIPVGIVAFPRGGARVESWLPRETVVSYGEDISPEAVAARTDYTRAFQMYNAMQVPLQGYTAKGFIWYQGCSNVGAHDQFVARMTDLVNRWRSDWGDADDAMPFYMVEIAPYLYSRDGGESGALLRQAQHEAAKAIPNAAIVCTNDLVEDYEAGNIHPAKKEPIGNRLAYLALNRDYGYASVPCYSPEAVGATVRERRGGGREIVVTLAHCYGLDRTEMVRGLEVRYGDEWHPVEQVRTGRNDQVVIRCEDTPSGVRYGWGDFKPGNLHGGDGLPVVPFRFLLEETR